MRRMLRSSAFYMAVCGSCVVLGDDGQQRSAQRSAFAPEHVAFFETEVLPILKAHCFKCHGAEPKLKGEFRITSHEGILKGGELGPAVDLDKPDDSQFLQAIKYEGLEMPPSGKLPPEKIAILTKWVQLGLPWSATRDYGVSSEPTSSGKSNADDGSSYWAYQPIRRPALPPVNRAGWVRNPIDAFVLAKLEAAELSPNSPAEKSALIRRVTYDLTGLPPTPVDVDRFLADDSPQAYERLIDQLLDSPQYGEKWGRHWLDLVRYAETHGYERDSPKPEAWRYRDYVIRSFNIDKPYDQFVIEQLAGDELDEMTAGTLTATGYYRLGLWDDEPADPLQARYDGLDDIVKTTGEVFLGMSLGCARCHGHKADPLPHTDYYSFLAYFHDVTHMNSGNLRYWATDADRQTHAELQRKKQEHESGLAAEMTAIELRLRSELQDEPGVSTQKDQSSSSARRVPDVVLPDSRQQGHVWKYTTEKPSDDWIQPDYSETSWDEGPGGFGTQGTPGAVVRTTWRTKDIWLRRWFDLKDVPPALALDLHHDEDCEIYLNGVLVHSVQRFAVEYQRIGLSKTAQQALRPGRNVIAVHCRQSGGGQYIDVGLVANAEFDLASLMKEHGERVLGRETVQRYATLVKQLEESRKAKLPEPGIPIMAVTESGRTQTHVLLRGNPHAKGAQVETAVPAVLKTTAPDVPQTRPKAGTSGKRLALARWLVAPENPLTARVFVNRLWHYHFGRGIVPTPNDFGKLGEQPSHPELLDWLASEFVSGGWKIKRTHKLMLLSNTYQQSSRSSLDEKSKTVDPGNALLWRFNPRRLTAEELRDSMLAVTGELNLKAGGPSIYVPIAAEVLQGQSRPGAGWGKSTSEDENRRSVYIHVKRSLLVPILEMHDHADTDSSCPVRYVTTVPTQSLGMLNGDFTNEKADRLAERLRREHPGDLNGQVRQAIRLTAGRVPAPSEVAEDVGFVKQLASKRRLNEQQAVRMYCLLCLNTNEFVYLD